MVTPHALSARPKTTTLIGVPEGSRQPPNMTANGMASARQRPMLDLPFSAPAARRSEAANPIIIAVSAMLDITVEMMAEMTMKPKMTRLMLPLVMRTTIAIKR